jgi:hypothetical protein
LPEEKSSNAADLKKGCEKTPGSIGRFSGLKLVGKRILRRRRVSCPRIIWTGSILFRNLRSA